MLWCFEVMPLLSYGSSLLTGSPIDHAELHRTCLRKLIRKMKLAGLVHVVPK